MKTRELLAPAGDIEAGYAALYYGADAVYLGLSKFSARANATNFDALALDEFTAYAHSLKRKVYVALNTILQESELSELIASLDVCTKCRVDGLIIQDLGVARVIKYQYPWFEMHASTQMAVHNKQGALFLQSMGFKRVVLARELTLPEIEDICSVEGLETEVFIHGALCYSYSGLCQFSAMEYARSANRGKCLYPCRAQFMCENKMSHLFSMKDLALQKDILKIPADSLKIEGRKKSALYVAAVTDYYRKMLDGKGDDAKKQENIKQIFSRPWCKFHFNGKDKTIIDREFVGHRGLHIGKVEKIADNCLYFKTSHKICRFDGIQIDVANDEKPFGFSVQKMFVGRKSVYEADKNTYVAICLPKNYPSVSKGENIYLASASEVKGAYNYTKPRPNEYKNTQNIDVAVDVLKDKICAASGEYSYQISANFEPAENVQKSTEAITKAFAKTKDTQFELKSLQINNADGLFVPASVANQLRRGLYETVKPKLFCGQLPQIDRPATSAAKQLFSIKTDNLNSLKLLNLDDFAQIIWQISPNSNIEQLKQLEFSKDKIRIALPAVCRHPQAYNKIISDLLTLGYNKWEVGNYWALNMLPRQNIDIGFDSSLYMLNTQAIQMAKELEASYVNLSIEDNKINICNLIKKSPLKTSLIIYRDVPLFTSVGCIRDNDCQNCNHMDKWFRVQKDEKKFAALSHDCQMMVFDLRPFCIASKVKSLKADYLQMDFCYMPYTPEKVKDLCAKLMRFENPENVMSANFEANNI